MSAIAGLIRLDHAPVQPHALMAMIQALKTHGPDGMGQWCQGPVGLAQCQMRQCPEDDFEKQPILFAAASRILVYDGRLDNRPELIDQLGLAAHEAFSWPDGALIGRAWERWGENAPSHLVGDFSFAIWDGLTHCLHLLRSPLGTRTLYYHTAPGLFAFSSMPQGLYTLASVPREVDFFYQAHQDPGLTFYRGLRQVLPGHHLRLSSTGRRETPFWQLDPDRQLLLPCPEAYEEALRSLLADVIRQQCRCRGKVGVMMSGGLDSSSVAALAAHYQANRGGNLPTFTQIPAAGFHGRTPPGTYGDETPLVQAMAQKHPNIFLNLVPSNPHGLFTDVENFFQAALHPFQNVANRPWFEAMFQQARAQGLGALLTGGGGNFTISWHGGDLLPSLLQRGQWITAWRNAQAVAQKQPSPRSAWRILASQGVFPLMPAFLQDLHARLRKTTRIGCDGQPLTPWLPHLTPREHAAHCHDHLTDRAKRYQLLMPGLSANFSMAMQAMFGVQDRDPTCDSRVVEFCFAVPAEQWLYQGQPRSLLRRAMANLLPQAILHNPARGYQSADWWAWLSTHGRPALLAEFDHLASSPTVGHSLDLPRLHRLILALPRDEIRDWAMRDTYQHVLLSGLMIGRFLAWYEEHWGRRT